MTNPARKMLRAKRKGKQAQKKKDQRFMRHRLKNLAALPHVIREWGKTVLGGFEAKGLVAGSVIPKPPTGKGLSLWRVVFVLPDGIQCAECGATSNDGEARYTVFTSGESKWLSASCVDCHKTREPGMPASPQKGDA
jgi:hypothetical protein